MTGPQPDPARQDKTIGTALGRLKVRRLLAAWVLGMFAVWSLGAIVGGPDELSNRLLIPAGLYLVPALWLLLKLSPSDLRALYGAKGPVPWRLVPWVVALLAVGVTFKWAWTTFGPALLLALAGRSRPPAGAWRAWDVAKSVILAPLIEELLFRGFILQRWTARYNRTAALLGSSLFFGALHFSDPIGPTVYGLCMALLYLRSGSLWLSTTAHACNNALAELTWDIPRGRSLVVVGVQVWPVAVPGFFLAPWLVHWVVRNWPSPTAPLPYFRNQRELPPE